MFKKGNGDDSTRCENSLREMAMILQDVKIPYNISLFLREQANKIHPQSMRTTDNRESLSKKKNTTANHSKNTRAHTLMEPSVRYHYISS
jgi:hypothetical protein